MKPKNRILFIIISTILACSVIFIAEQVLKSNYAINSLIKIVLFIGIPALYKLKVDKSKDLFSYFRWPGVKAIVPSIIAGVIFFVIVIGAYIFLSSQIDLPGIADDLSEKLHITPMNFIFVGLYIIFINSFLEELLFRGFMFIELKNKIGKVYAHGISALLFSLYHMAAFSTWFNPLIITLALVGLFSVGILFNWMNDKKNSILPSWIAHAAADVAIIIIGFYMFGLI